MIKAKKTSALLIGASLLLSIPTMSSLAEGTGYTGPTVGGGLNIAEPYAGNGTFIPGVPNPNSIPQGGIPYMPVEPERPFIPGVPNPNSNPDNLPDYIEFVDFDKDKDKDKDQKGNVRNVKAGESFSITLKENASTGYTWTYTATPSMGITQMGVNESGKKDSDSKTVGQETKKTWTFLANKAGTYTLTFKYARANGAAEKTQTYTVYVK